MTAEQIPLDEITSWTPPGSCESLHMLRLDRIHPVVSGNKWFKLQPHLQAAAHGGYTRVLSFGGGYSNHLVALAYAAREAGMQALGLVRGHYATLTHSLQACRDYGMQLAFLEGTEFTALKNGGPSVSDAYPGYFVIPEGGANDAGIAGASQLASLIPAGTTDVCLAVGTGTTLAGLDLQLLDDVLLHGYCAARECTGAMLLSQRARVPGRICWDAVADPRFGRWRPELLQFMRDFYAATGIPLDVVYTGKMMQAVAAGLHRGQFSGRRIVCLHTGGLQGNPTGLFASP